MCAKTYGCHDVRDEAKQGRPILLSVLCRCHGVEEAFPLGVSFLLRRLGDLEARGGTCGETRSEADHEVLLDLEVLARRRLVLDQPDLVKRGL